jgi:AraC family transcriptional regulator, regulatory protein of adaptative response / DNA-3-methyladenine glycosylase II
MTATRLDFESCYRALESRDPRFDGVFVVGVRTTRIYCRPSCPTPVHPKRRNVSFYRTAAAAQLAGLRACKRCRPDAVAGSPEWDARGDLVGRAMRLLGDGVVDREGVPGLARRLAVSERHLCRLLVEELGAPPLALARARRAQTARVLIETTDLPFRDIALGAGFGSVRQFNETVREVFAAAPTELRHARRSDGRLGAASLKLRLPLRSPFDGRGILAWLGARAVPGVEAVEGGVYRRVLRLPGGIATLRAESFDDHVAATFRLSAVSDLATAVYRTRRLFDLDTDPEAIRADLASDDALGSIVVAAPGRRVPGSLDGAESAIRAVLGQQISVPGARTIAGRIARVLGTPLDAAFDEPDRGLASAFPTADVLAEADLSGLGLTGARQRTLRELAGRLAAGTLVIDVGADRHEARRQLLEIPGVGPWTASYVALRALGDPDVLLAEDLGVRRAAATIGLPTSPRQLLAHAERWRPWRSYATHHLWAVGAVS